ncbi:MAG: hypothetical protein IJX27_01260, partial [Clostridia bacterium]|nr:hypothetical protein [Clostridia bacterium]
ARGKTYHCIDKLEYFHNAVFDTTKNTSAGFTAEEFNAMVAKVKELHEVEGQEYFCFYVQDGTALIAAAIAANAGLTAEEFHVYMCEDGTGAYNALYNTYIKDRSVTAESDGPYEQYKARVTDAKNQFDAIMAKKDNKHDDYPMGYDIGKAFALASLPNFTYIIQDESTVVSIIGDKTALGAAFGIEGNKLATEYKLNLRYQKISAAVDALTEAQRTDYLTLMYGDYYAATYAALTRTERAGKSAPEKKLVFIGSRHHGYADLVSNADYGIGSVAAFPTSYAALPSKYKTELLFPTAQDYEIFLNVINDPSNYTDGASNEAKSAAKWACLNMYMDYIYTLKFTYALYGEDYDIIMKGHPREVIGESDQWNNQYGVGYGDGQVYYYDKLMDAALLAFHASDSVGKYIGMVPYGTSAENLAYLGADIAIAGLPSSTYNGFDTDVDVLFILAETNEDIAGDASQVKSRYEAGNLLYTDKNGEKQTAVFYNIGNIYKSLAAIYESKGNADMAGKYSELYKTWLATNRNGAEDIDAQGFAK